MACGVLPIMADLLDTMLVELSELTQTVADLEQQQEAIRLKLASVRALQAELLGTADVLNRQRHKTTNPLMAAPLRVTAAR
jgi:hypothetical protein